MRSVSPFERYGKANPLADATLRIHTVDVTDTISNLADKYLGDWRLWRLIAERNEITDVRQMTPGTQLIIPRLPLETGRYESL
jgi:nucleoid-associated protein YgaU